MKTINLRSDTVTQPTQKMREAIYNAIVGDDVYEDDPTVKQLESMAADMLGKEAALFVPSGTFGNQLCILTHTLRGDEVLIPESNHIIIDEVGASATISGVQLRYLRSEFGEVDIDELQKKIRLDDIHFPRTGLICLENAHSTGVVVELENIKAVYEVACKRGIPVHMDGARIFNAAVFAKIEAKEYARYCDSLTFCLSKGLCAPIGSIVVGDKGFIKRARKNRKLMGGGMRQVGFLAAAGIVALTDMVDRLEEDHKNAEILATYLDMIEEISICKERRDISMVFFTFAYNDKISSDKELVKILGERNILINGEDGGIFALLHTMV